MDFLRLFDILPYQQAKYPQKMALASRQEGKWAGYTTEECLRMVDRLSIGLLRLGLRRGDAVALFAHCGSPAWNFVDFAAQQTGAIPVPIHATAMGKDVAHILNDASVRYCFVSNRAMLERIQAVQGQAPGLQGIFSFEKIPGTPHWQELLAEPAPEESATSVGVTSSHADTGLLAEPSLEEQATLEALKDSIAETDLATILYTSGSTGIPKGVRLSHRNVVSNIKAMLILLPVNHRKTALSYLPLSHIMERMSCCLYMAAGASVWYSESVEHFSEDVQEVRPHFFTAVPRVLEKMYDRISESRHGRGFLGKKTLDWAIARGENYDPLENLSPFFWLRHRLLDLLVYRHWRKALGGRVEGIVAGAAALQPRLARLLCAAGIRTREGYGLTETSPAVAFNHLEPGMYHFGTVGLPIPGVEVKIDEPDENGEGEILVHGPNVMQGYHHLPDETAAVLSPDGWLRTGDVGKFVHRRFLQITDRKRDIFKTSTGKFVAPQRVENELRLSHFVKQCMAIGLNRPFVAALIVPDFTALEWWCRENKVHWTAPQFMALNPKVLKMMEGVVEGINQSLEPHEQVRKFTLLHEEWTPQGGELTLTMKLARGVLAGKFKKEIEGMYKS